MPAAGFLPGLEARLEAGVASGLLPGLHAVAASRRGARLERCWPGLDECWGEPLGRVAFGPETLHDLRSVTKSVVGLLYGIALERGLVPPPEALLHPHFSCCPPPTDARQARTTVLHALTMTLGTDWDEQRPYSDPENSEIAMERAPDRIRYVLERPSVAEPGSRWIYSGGALALLGHLIAQGAGLPLEDFAREALFSPLGIERFAWTCGSDGVASAASGLRLGLRDLLRVGEMLLQGGRWEGRQVVPEAWLQACFAPAVAAEGGLDYGRLWFLGEAPVGPSRRPGRWIGAFGNGGQRLYLLPEAGAAAAVFCGNYNAPDGWVTPTRIWREILLPNLAP